MIKIKDTPLTCDNFILKEGNKQTLLWYDKHSKECSLTYEDEGEYSDINEFKYGNIVQTMIKAMYK